MTVTSEPWRGRPDDPTKQITVVEAPDAATVVEGAALLTLVGGLFKPVSVSNPLPTVHV